MCRVQHAVFFFGETRNYSALLSCVGRSNNISHSSKAQRVRVLLIIALKFPIYTELYKCVRINKIFLFKVLRSLSIYSRQERIVPIILFHVDSTV